MKREKVESLNERDFVTSLIVSTKCCKTLAPYVNLEFFESEYAAVVTSWVLEYYKKFKECPKDNIRSLYLTHQGELQDESLKDLVASFLQNLADSNININNEDYLLDRSKDFLDSRALKLYTEKLNACLEVGDMKKARKVQAEYKKISEVETNEVSLFSKSSTKIIQESLSKVDEELMYLPENLNKVTGKLHRNDFMAILAAPKKGKSWFLQYLATEAVKQSLNVVFVSMEMSREEVVQRMWKMMYGSKSGIVPEGIYECAKIVPSDEGEGKFTSELFDISVKPGCGKSVQYLQKQSKALNKYKGDLRIIAYPAFGASVEEISQRVEELASENFVADVLVIDYADITKSIGGGSEPRNQLDLIWKHLRYFAMKFHCLVITASQTNRSAINSSIVDITSVSEDIRKAAHCTTFVSMEQTNGMRKNHLMRIRNMLMRNGEIGKSCVFPQCLGLGQFVLGEPVDAEQFIFDCGMEES